MLMPLTGSKRGRSPCPPAGSSSSSSSFSCPSSWSPPPCWETRCPAVRPAPDPRSAWPAGAPAPGDTTGSSECKCSSPQSEGQKRESLGCSFSEITVAKKKEGRRGVEEPNYSSHSQRAACAWCGITNQLATISNRIPLWGNIWTRAQKFNYTLFEFHADCVSLERQRQFGFDNISIPRLKGS